MAIAVMQSPCWYNRRDFTLHADTYTGLPAPGARPRAAHHRLPHCCARAYCDRCNRAASGTEVRGVDGADHFPSRDFAAYWLTEHGWTTNGLGRWHCPDCPVLFALTPAAHALLAA